MLSLMSIDLFQDLHVSSTLSSHLTPVILSHEKLHLNCPFKFSLIAKTQDFAGILNMIFRIGSPMGIFGQNKTRFVKWVVDRHSANYPNSQSLLKEIKRTE